MTGIKAIDKLRELADKLDESAARMSEHGFSPLGIRAAILCDEIEREVDDLIDDMGMVSVDGYEVPFNTLDALHMVLGAAADCFDTPEDAVRYLQGETSMLLPVDSDGVPIRVGDKIEHRGHTGDVWLFGANEIMCTDRVCYPIEECHLVKPRTLEDVLADFAAEVEHDNNTIETARKYAAEIRELMSKAGDAE